MTRFRITGLKCIGRATSIEKRASKMTKQRLQAFKHRLHPDPCLSHDVTPSASPQRRIQASRILSRYTTAGNKRSELGENRGRLTSTGQKASLNGRCECFSAKSKQQQPVSKALSPSGRNSPFPLTRSDVGRRHIVNFVADKVRTQLSFSSFCLRRFLRSFSRRKSKRATVKLVRQVSHIPSTRS